MPPDSFDFSVVFQEQRFHVSSNANAVQSAPLVNEHPHRHSFLELHYIFQGEETIHLPEKGERIPIRQGQIALIPRQTYHRAETKPGEAILRFCFCLHPNAAPSGSNPFEDRFFSLKHVFVFESPFLTQAMNRCRDMLENQRGTLQTAKEGILLTDLILELFQFLPEASASPSPQSPTKLRQKQIIDEHLGTCYHSGDGLAGLAEKLFLSQRQTRKLIQQFYGKDYKTLVTDQRMKIATFAMQDPKKSLEEIAEHVGYRSYSGFHLAFVRSFGIPPGAFRKMKEMEKDDPADK